MMVDIGDTIAPKSDQLDAVDLLTGPRTFTIERASRGPADQPVNLHLSEFPRPWRPGVSMRRVLVALWGRDASQYVGRRVPLWCDPDVSFGGQKVGGIRVTHMSHIDQPRSVPLIITKGRSAMYRVQPLVEDAPPAVSQQQIEQAIKHYADTFGVTVEQLETRVGKPRGQWDATDVNMLRALAGELSRGDRTVADEFPAAQEDSQPVAGPEADPFAAGKRR